MTNKKSFIVRCEWWRACADLNDCQFGILMRALFLYVETGEVQICDELRTTFNLLRNVIDTDCAKYERTVERRREAGRKGGAPVGNSNANKQKQAKTSKNNQIQANSSKNKQKQAKQPDTVTDTDTDTDTVILINENKNIGILTDTRHPGDDAKAQKPTVDFEALRNYWNETMLKYGAIIPALTSLGTRRQSAIKARCREHGRKALQTVIDNAAQSDFLNGRSNTNFVGSFDWIFKPTNFQKVLEGNYSNHTNHKTNGANNINIAECVEIGVALANSRNK